MGIYNANSLTQRTQGPIGTPAFAAVIKLANIK